MKRLIFTWHTRERGTRSPVERIRKRFENQKSRKPVMKQSSSSPQHEEKKDARCVTTIRDEKEVCNRLRVLTRNDEVGKRMVALICKDYANSVSGPITWQKNSLNGRIHLT